MNKIPQNIFIPHLRYTIKIRKFKNPPTYLKKPDAYTTFIDDHTASIHLKSTLPTRVIAHEVVHILQEICRDRNMNFLKEEEHMAYLMQYILGRITGEIEY